MWTRRQRIVAGDERTAEDRTGLHWRSQLRRRQLHPGDSVGRRAAAAARQEERRVRQRAEHLQVPHRPVSARDRSLRTLALPARRLLPSTCTVVSFFAVSRL